MSRREFLGTAVAAALPIRPRTVRHWLVEAGRGGPMLMESVLGFQSALPQHLAVNHLTVHRLSSALVIFPTSRAAPDIPSLIGAHLRSGSTVILESGAGFSSGGACDAYRQWMREELGITVAAPVDLWSGRTRGIPYIEYDWPIRASVRDFSRVVRVAAQPCEVIARAGDVAVALKRRFGKGTLIYLGSPLGPALWAGDLEARRWLERVFAG